MKRGLAIIAHAIRMLIHDPGNTLRVVLPGLLLVLGSTLAASALIPETLSAMVSAAPDALLQVPLMDVIFMVVLALAGLLGYALMAIFWHRHVLLNGPNRSADVRPGGAVIAGYIWRAVIVALVQFIAAVPILLAMGVLIGLTGGPAQGGPAILPSLIAGIAFVWVALRISIVLPAAAMGIGMRIAESWAITAPMSAAIFAVAALLSLLNITVSVLVGLIFPDPGGFALMIETGVFLLEGLLVISVLTTLFGHLVEGRSLG